MGTATQVTAQLPPQQPLVVHNGKELPTTGADNATLETVEEIFRKRNAFNDGFEQPFQPTQYISSQFPSQHLIPRIPQHLMQPRRPNTYLGHTTIGSNQVDNLPPHLNTCVWVTNAPGNLTHGEFLSYVRSCGKVFSLHINPPDVGHNTAAVKLAFCTRIGFERFMEQGNTGMGIWIRGRKLRVQPNRNMYRENSNYFESRVLKITGPAKYCNYDVLRQYFTHHFYYNLIKVEYTTLADVKMGGINVMIWEFGSILSQAHFAKACIERDPLLKHMLAVEYAPDPCA
jgi:hypothetical protein